jgi:hypothetical protein
MEQLIISHLNTVMTINSLGYCKCNNLVVNAKDDMFDYTQGYTGTITNACGVRELGYNDVTSDPRGIEGDGNFDGLLRPQSDQSNPTLIN